MGHSWVSILGWITLAASLLIAWSKGAWPERFGALLLLCSNVLSDVAMAISYPLEPRLTLFGIDFLLAVGLLALAIRFSSIWLGLAMLLQSFALLQHALVLGGYGLPPIQWMILNNIISQLMLGCIVAASVISWRSRRKTKPPAFYTVADPTPV